MKSLLKKGAILLAGSLLTVGTLYAKEKPVTLTLHHFLSPKAPPHAKILMPWAKKLEKATNGKIKVEIFPAMTMGGKPNELYKQVRDGSADIVFTIAGYTPGLFTRTESVELPTVHTNSSRKTTTAIKENFHLLEKDFRHVHPIYVGTSGPYQLSTTTKKVDSIDDLKGLKLRSPSRTGAWYISELGAEPVGMPVPATPQALGKGAVDGILMPMEVFPAFKFQNLTKYTTEINGGGGFGGSVTLVLMNKDRFNSLPKNLQDAIDKSSEDLFNRFVKINETMEEVGKGIQKKSGGEIVTLTAEATKAFDAAGERTVQRWVKEVNGKNIDGQEIIDALRKSIANQ